MRNKIKFLLFI